MAPTIVAANAVHAFKDARAFAKWLKASHATVPELWLKIARAGSGIATVSYAEALDEALCWGWIDGQKKPLDAQYWLQRFVPRGKRSIWSKTNRTHTDRLLAAGRMQPQGQAQIDAAKADGRWDKAYAGASSMEIPDDLLAAIEAEPAALALFGRLNGANRYALAFRVHAMKTAAGRSKKIAGLVDMLKRGETPHPNGKGK
jgi:uncharacterized protein YdeI (YjbR/CyaY-like superfamily)